MTGLRSKGHWPAGKRRSDVRPVQMAGVMRKLARVLRTEHTGHHPRLHAADRVSIKSLARYLDVSDRTVRRWLSGEDWPPAAMVKQIKRWLEK